MSDLTTHDVLVAAKAYLMQHGWKQGGYGVGGGPRCLAGALRSACGIATDARLEYAAKPRANNEAARLLSELVVGDVARCAIPRWNDAPERTIDEVIALLDEAILATAPTSVEPK